MNGQRPAHGSVQPGADMPDRTEQILVHLEYLRKGQDATNAHLTTLNGRVNSTEDRLLVMETRSSDARGDARGAGRNWGLGAAAVGTAIGSALAAWFAGK